MTLRWPSSVTMIMVGMMWLGSSLLARHAELTETMALVVLIGGWLGSILVVVGLGWMLFLDE
jgi:hypothetical protein